MTRSVASLGSTLTNLGPASGNATPQDRRGPYRHYLEGLYRDLLGHLPPTTLIEDWVQQLLSGVNPRTAVGYVLNSVLYREKLVYEFYEKLLGRTPNEEGLGFWSGLLASRSQEECLAAILSSSEYFQRSGGSNDRYVRALFQDILQRRSAEMEADAWIGLLNSHSASRLQVAFDFVTSEECRVQLVRNWYWFFLRREPAAEIVGRAVSQLKAGASREEMLCTILSSKEYFTRTVVG